MWKTSKTCTAICSQIDRGIPFSVYPSSAPHPGRYREGGRGEREREREREREKETDRQTDRQTDRLTD